MPSSRTARDGAAVTALRPVGWEEARRIAWLLGAERPAPARTMPVGDAVGRTVRTALHARQPLPSFDNSAMDGWAVSGEGPWWEGPPVLAGASDPPEPLRAGEARPIATGAPVPPGTIAIVRSEHARRGDGDGSVPTVTLLPGRHIPTGADLRRRGEELRRGELLAGPGARITPPLAGLLLAAGIVRVEVADDVRVTTFAIGDELIGGGPAAAEPPHGRVVDSLSPQLGPILAMLGASHIPADRIPDHTDAVVAALDLAQSGLVVTTGGTARGPADPLRPALGSLGAHPLLDGVALRPGGSVLLSRLPSGTRILSLPGNPLAALVDLLLLGSALVDGALGRPLVDLPECAVPAGLDAQRVSRAVACVESGGELRPVDHQRSGMLRGLAEATHLVLVAPAGHDSRGPVSARALRLPWS